MSGWVRKSSSARAHHHRLKSTSVCFNFCEFEFHRRQFGSASSFGVGCRRLRRCLGGFKWNEPVSTLFSIQHSNIPSNGLWPRTTASLLTRAKREVGIINVENRFWAFSSYLKYS